MVGETALARQLSKLAVPQTSLLVQGKIRKSFLFDHRDAAALDKDVFYSYGTTGLDKLKLINPQFEKFEQNLFSVNYIGFERAVQTASVNKKLDEKIVEFLRMLSPYFLIRSAHEALEWLIYRFHVHMYNTDELVASVLPHFNTSTFVRVIQLLNLENPNSRWAWLKPLQESGVHLEYGAVLNRFNTDGEFRKLVCNLAPNSFNVYSSQLSVATPVISFSMCTILCALGRSEKVTDSTITFLFPYILKGLKSNFNKYIAASYLVISKIIEVVQLKDELVTEILMKVFENVPNDLEEKAFELLLIVFQRQPIKVLTKDMFRVLLSKKSFLECLVALSSSFECTSLFSAIIKRLIPTLLAFRLRRSNTNKSKKLLKFVTNMLQSVDLSDKSVHLCFNTILCTHSKLQLEQQFDQNTLKKTTKLLLKQLEMRYPNCFDKAISQYFKKKDGKNNAKLLKLINDSVCSVKNELVPKIQTTLVLGVNHNNPKIRQFSTRYLLKRAASEAMSDADFVGSAMYERLLDDCADVVLEVLSSPETLLKYVEKKNALKGFSHILSRKIREKANWYQAQMKCLNIICDFMTDDEDLRFDIFVAVLPFIFPLKQACIKGFVQIFNSKLKDSLPIIQALELPDSVVLDPDSVLNAEQLAELNLAVFSSTTRYIDKLDATGKSSFVSNLMNKDENMNNNSFLTLSVYAIGHAVVSFKELAQKELCVRQLLKFLKSFSFPKVCIENVSNIDKKALTQLCVDSLCKQQFPAVVIYHVLFRIVRLMKLDYDSNNVAPWIFEDYSPRFSSFNILSSLFEFCIEQIDTDKPILVDVFKSILSVFFDSQFETPQHLIGFLSSLWSNALGNVSVTLQTAALVRGNTLCRKSSKFDWFFESYPLCISLLKAIASPEVEVRKSSLALLSSLLQCSETCESPLRYLAKDVYENQEEIIVDTKQCFYLLNNWFAPAVDIYGHPNYKSVLNSDMFDDLQYKYCVLDHFIQVLKNDSTVNNIKYFILLSLQEKESEGILSAYIPVINYFLQLAKENDKILDKLSYDIVDLLLQKFSPKTASVLQEESVETETLFKCLEIIAGNSTKYLEIQMSLLKVFSREFFTAIPSIPVQKKLLTILLNLYMNSTSEISGQLKKVLGKLCTFVYLILKDILEKDEAMKKSTTLREVKKSKTGEGTTNTIESKMWKQITVLLEIVQNKSKLNERELLIPELFNLLNKTLSFDTQSSVEYVRQLILSSIYNCCQHLGSEGLDERQFQVELIVQCIRSSTNPKTHHQSLLLLNLAATIFPDYVLNNVMSIFTFMGSSLIRQDDSYSIQVISQTIETIVPSLLAASNLQKENEAMQIVASVIRVFVDSLSDIPRHRQLPLFSKLITTLEPSKYLWVPLAQICDQYATVFHDMISEDFDRKLSPVLEFAVNFHKQFSPSVQIDTCINLLHFLSQLPDSKQETSHSINFKEPFDVTNHTDQQLQIYKYNILSYINIWLSSQSFVSQVSELDSKAQHGLEEKYEALLEKSLHYLQHQRDLKRGAEDSSNRYSLFSLLYDLVGHINALLPCSLFIRVVRRLIQNPEPVIKKKAIELLNSKLEQQQHLFTEENHSSMLKLLNPLLNVVQEFESEDMPKVENSALNQQTALYALHLLTKLISSNYPKKFHKVLNLTVHILKDNKNQELTVNALLCLAQLCVSLNVQVLPHLNTFMPIIVDLLTDYRTIDLNDCLILGIITALQSLIENVGMFLSIYMQSLVTGICLLSTKYSEANKNTIHEKLLNFQTLLAKDVSLRILLTALEDSYTFICAQNPKAVIPLMNILGKKLGFCTSSEVESSLSQLEKFYILVLGFQSSHSSKAMVPVSSVETSIISAFKTFVVKLSVTRFRLFFQKVYQWVVATEDPEEEKLKVCTFYSLTSELSKTLKSLFIVAAKYFLKHAASELDSNNSSKNKELESSKNPLMVTQLLNNILDTLTTCFLHDDGHLLDKDSFECLMQPLVDQLENLFSNETVYQERVSNYLNNCIAHLMAAVSDNTLWKKLNYQILLKTRHDSPVVRFAAIQAIREVVTVMGDNYLVLLPESIPFLAEVMEDESSEVEHECQSVIEEMEKILGEPIRKYF